MKEKTIELGKVRQGERFKLDGVEFVKLDCDEEATFVVTSDTLPECCAFEDDDAEREDHNNFDGSLIQKHMERFWRKQYSPIFKAIVERPIDLTSMDGMTTYGKPFISGSHPGAARLSTPWAGWRLLPRRTSPFST